MRARMKAALPLKTGNASIIPHPHIVCANWSLCLNNVRPGLYFLPRFVCVYTCALSAGLSSAIPGQYGGVHGGWHRTTEPSTPIYASFGDLATDVYEVRKVRRRRSAARCTLLTLKVWPQFSGGLENTQWFLLFRCTSVEKPEFLSCCYCYNLLVLMYIVNTHAALQKLRWKLKCATLFPYSQSLFSFLRPVEQHHMIHRPKTSMVI